MFGNCHHHPNWRLHYSGTILREKSMNNNSVCGQKCSDFGKHWNEKQDAVKFSFIRSSIMTLIGKQKKHKLYFLCMFFCLAFCFHLAVHFFWLLLLIFFTFHFYCIFGFSEYWTDLTLKVINSHRKISHLLPTMETIFDAFSFFTSLVLENKEFYNSG